MDLPLYFSKLDLPDGGEHVPVKAALLKYFYDKGFYFKVKDLLDGIYDCFTLDKMISLWAGYEVSLYPEEPVVLGPDSRRKLDDILKSRTVNMNGSGTGIIGRVYEKSLDSAYRKEMGITYTPEDICDYVSTMLRGKTDADTVFMDPACGCGTFLEIFYDNIIRYHWNNSGELKISEVHEQVLKNNIYGCDSSAFACAIAKVTLALKYQKFVLCENIVHADSLTELPGSFNGKFDVVSSNPPYIGHKTIKAEYRARIRDEYAPVYYNKADISYCFFMLGERLLKENGTLLYISSRYFAQSQYARGLRKFILDNFRIQKVIDFYGARPFHNAGIDPMIILLRKERDTGEYTVPSVRFLTSRPGVGDILDSPVVETIRTSSSLLSPEGFNFLSSDQLDMRKLVETGSSMKLSELCEFFQGVITGCDKAFVTQGEDECTAECGKKWIKSSSLKKDHIEYRGQYVLYTDRLASIEDAPHTLERISEYRDRLSGRRECASGAKEWFRLQWGRREQLFDADKIVFPYKSADSRFTVDREGYCFSADVYGMTVREKYSGKVDLDCLARLLNSELYTSYFRSYAKKLGGALYEYYPNTVGELPVPSADIINTFVSEEAIDGYFRGNER